MNFNQSLIFIFILGVYLMSCQDEKKDRAEKKHSRTEKKTEKKRSAPVEPNITQTNDSIYKEINELKGFEGYYKKSGAMINDSYGVSIARNKRNNEERLIVYNEIHRNKEGEAYYKLIDTVKIQSLGENHFIGFFFCMHNDKRDEEIVAIYQHEDYVEYYTKIIKAWRLNSKKVKIEKIPADEVKCINDGYGA